MDKEQQITADVLQNMRDNPNSHLNEIHNEVSMLNKKIEPILERDEVAAQRVKSTTGSRLSGQAGPVGMLSKMGGRLIAFYADDLAESLLDDFLEETAHELQRIEKLEAKSYNEKEAHKFAEGMLDAIAKY